MHCSTMAAVLQWRQLLAEMEDSENSISFGYVWKSGGISLAQVQWVSAKIS